MTPPIDPRWERALVWWTAFIVAVLMVSLVIGGVKGGR